MTILKADNYNTLTTTKHRAFCLAHSRRDGSDARSRTLGAVGNLQALSSSLSQLSPPRAHQTHNTEHREHGAIACVASGTLSARRSDAKSAHKNRDTRAAHCAHRGGSPMNGRSAARGSAVRCGGDDSGIRHTWAKVLNEQNNQSMSVVISPDSWRVKRCNATGAIVVGVICRVCELYEESIDFKHRPRKPTFVVTPLRCAALAMRTAQYRQRWRLCLSSSSKLRTLCKNTPLACITLALHCTKLMHAHFTQEPTHDN